MTFMVLSETSVIYDRYLNIYFIILFVCLCSPLRVNQTSRVQGFILLHHQCFLIELISSCFYLNHTTCSMTSSTQISPLTIFIVSFENQFIYDVMPFFSRFLNKHVQIFIQETFFYLIHFHLHIQ